MQRQLLRRRFRRCCSRLAGGSRRLLSGRSALAATHNFNMGNLYWSCRTAIGVTADWAGLARHARDLLNQFNRISVTLAEDGVAAVRGAAAAHAARGFQTRVQER